MNFMCIPEPSAPRADSDAVRKLRISLKNDATAVKVPVFTEGSPARERDCYMNVRNRVEREGGRMQLGWSVWQHAHLFIEGERHAVFDPGGGRGWIDCTPHLFPGGTECREILFIPDIEDTEHDFNADIVTDNVRVPLVDDPRVSEALNLFSKATLLMNSVPGIDVELPRHVGSKVARLRHQACVLLSASALQDINRKIGRNDPCPCGNGKKYKKCHGA